MSRDDVKKIYDEYTTNQAKLAEFKSQPRPVSKFPVPPQKPPVPDGRQEQLNNQARTIMFGLSGEIIQAKTQIVKPTLYDPDRPRLDSEVTDGPTIVAPKVPPVATYDPTSSAGGGLGSARHSAPDSGTNPGNGSSFSKPAEQSGLVLSGADPAFNAQLGTRPGAALLSPLGGGAASGHRPYYGNVAAGSWSTHFQKYLACSRSHRRRSIIDVPEQRNRQRRFDCSGSREYGTERNAHHATGSRHWRSASS